MSSSGSRALARWGAIAALLAALTGVGCAAGHGAGPGADAGHGPARAPDPAPRPTAALVPRVRLFAPEPIRNVWPHVGPRSCGLPDREVLVPGQALAVGVLAEGEGRDALLAGTTLAFRIRDGARVTDVPPQRPAAVKGMKAEGASQVLDVLQASGVAEADLEKVAEASSLVSLGVVLPEWTAPEGAARRTVVVEGEAILPDGTTVALAPAQVAVETWEAASARPPFDDDPEATQRWLDRYALLPEPQHLAALVKLSVRARAHPLVTVGLPSFGVQEFPAVAPRFAAALAGADERTRVAGAIVLRWAGQDPAPLLATLPAERRAEVEGYRARPDPFALDVDSRAAEETPRRMDLLWSLYMITGRPEPVRAIVDLLRFREDYSALQAARAAGPQDRPADRERIFRGVLYVTAGWSLSSFVAKGGPAADFVERWKDDPAVPEPIRNELRGLSANPAFRASGKGRKK